MSDPAAVPELRKYAIPDSLRPWSFETAQFARNVRLLRRASGMTVRDLAAASGVVISHLSAMEFGKTRGRSPSAGRVAAAFGVSLADLNVREIVAVHVEHRHDQERPVVLQIVWRDREDS